MLTRYFDDTASF